MTQRVFVALLTIAIFVAGYTVRMWTERGQPVPPPPPALAQEYSPAAANAPTEKEKRELDRKKLVDEIQKLRPQIEAYTAQVEEINAEYDREMNAILTPKQREKRMAYLKRRAERDAKRLSDPEPLSDEEIIRERERSNDIYWLVTVTPLLERLTKEYNLDAAQQASVRALLSMRRNRFIALFDATPHPSVRLSRLAPLIERVMPPEEQTLQAKR